jgi:tRNA(Ile)-lysidine synthase
MVLQEALSDFSAEHHIDLQNSRTLLAVSGGVDSMVLAHLFLLSGFPFALAHVNFGLRGAESDGDEKLVQEFAELHQIPLFRFHPETQQYAKEEHWSIQMAARELRYDFFQRCALQEGFDQIATAHHADDALENFFIYLMRGNTRAALSGIAPVRGMLIRPLLRATREQIEAYATGNKVLWRDDSSNAKTDYLRNRIRHTIIPGVREFYPGIYEDFEPLVAGLRKYFSEEDELFSGLIEANSNKENEDILVSGELLDADKGPQALRWYFRSLGFSGDAADKLLNGVATGAHFVAGKHTVYKEATGFRVLNSGSELEAFAMEVTQDSLPTTLYAGLFAIDLAMLDATAYQPAPDTWYFDMEGNLFPLVFRSRKTGDRLSPWGANFSRKVSDILVDAKISAALKNGYPLVEAPVGILGLLGIRRSNLAPVQAESKVLLQMKWRFANSEWPEM